jgi:hypothetical protein
VNQQVAHANNNDPRIQRESFSISTDNNEKSCAETISSEMESESPFVTEANNRNVLQKVCACLPSAVES